MFLDYCVAALGIVFLVSLFQWIVDGRKNFTGPRVNIDEFSHGIAVEQAQEDSGEETREKTAGDSL